MIGWPEVSEPPPRRMKEASCREKERVVAGWILGPVGATPGDRMPGEPRCDGPGNGWGK
jgi:hypothetical protein